MASRSGLFLLPGKPSCGRTALYWSLCWVMATVTRATSQLSVPPKSQLQIAYPIGVPDRAAATISSKDAILLHIHTQACWRPFSIYTTGPIPAATLGNLPSQLPPLSPTHTHPHHFCWPAKTPMHTLASLLTHTLTHAWSHPYHCLAVQYQFCGLCSPESLNTWHL